MQPNQLCIQQIRGTGTGGEADHQYCWLRMHGAVPTCMVQFHAGMPNMTIHTHKPYVLPTLCVYLFCLNLRTNSDYFPIQH
jgi:hypothetical protein